jgi:LacI family transcriptional regulator
MTVHEIAALAGVSIGTVDRLLHKRGRVSAATKAKIEAIIEQYRFTPNLIARQLKRNRSYRFCALIPCRDQDAGYWGQIIEGIEQTAGEIKLLGVETEIIEFNRYDPAAFEKTSGAVLAGKPDGLLFAPIMPKYTRPFVGNIYAEKIPLVFVDADMPGTAPLCAIGQDSVSGGYLA